MRCSGLAVTTLALALVAGCGAERQEGESAPATQAPAGADRGKLYVANENDTTISVIDAASQAVAKTIAVDDASRPAAMYMPHNVQAAPDGRTVWVTLPVMQGAPVGTPDELVVIDATTDSLLARFDVGVADHVAHVVFDPAGRHAYVTANATSEILRVDAATRAVVKRFALGDGKGPHGARWCGDALYLAYMEGKAIGVLDPSTDTVRQIPVGGVAVQVGCTPDARFVFASLYDSREVVRLERATGDLVRIQLPADAQGPVQVYPSADSRRLYVCDQGILDGRPTSNRLYEVDVDAATVTATIEVGAGAHGVVLDEDGSRAYVTGVEAGTVSVVDTAARQTVATVPVGARPNGISHAYPGGAMP